MLFLQQNKVGVAFTMNRDDAGGALCQKEAEQIALRELEKEGIKPRHGVTIEAYESKTGWLVFCMVTQEDSAEIYIEFSDEDDFLDAVSAIGTAGVKLSGWRAGNGREFTVCVAGERSRVLSYAERMCEFGCPFEAPQGYARHIREQSGGLFTYRQ